MLFSISFNNYNSSCCKEMLTMQSLMLVPRFYAATQRCSLIFMRFQHCCRYVQLCCGYGRHCRQCAWGQSNTVGRLCQLSIKSTVLNSTLLPVCTGLYTTSTRKHISKAIMYHTHAYVHIFTFNLPATRHLHRDKLLFPSHPSPETLNPSQPSPHTTIPIPT